MPDERLQVNHAFLARHFPELLQSIQNDSIPPSALQPQIALNDTKQVSMRVKLVDGPRYLHSKRDPVQEAERWAETQQPQPGAIAVIMGWGAGHYALEWIDKFGSRCTGVLIWEPEPQLFVHSLPYVNLERLNKTKNIQLLLGGKDGIIYQALHGWLSYLLSNELKILAAPFVDIYGNKTVELLKKDIQYIVDQKNGALSHIETMGYQCQTHLLQNLIQSPYCWLPHDLAGLANGQPAFIVGAGPSLDKNKHLLKKIDDKGWILAVDTSLPILLDSDIHPDLVVTKDPTDLNRHHFTDLPEGQLPVLAFDPQVPPSTPQIFNGPKIWMPGRHRQLYQYISGMQLQAVDEFPFSTNVALAAFNLACALGCDPIIFVGLDFCFAGTQGSSHAENATLKAETSFDSHDGTLIYKRGEAQDKVKGIMVEGIDGREYPTIANFYEALRLLERLISNSGKHCIDATEGGAKIPGTEIVPLTEAIQTYCINGLNKQWPETLLPRNLEEIKKSLAAMVEYIEENHAVAMEALNIFKDNNCPDCVNIADFEMKRKLLEADNKLYGMLEPALERLLVEIDRPGFFDDALGEQELMPRYAWYFSEIEKACARFAPLVRESMNAL